MAPPAITRSPASSRSPAAATSLAAATSERTGWPRIAAVEPICAGSSSTSITRPRLAVSVAGSLHGPTTIAAAEQLSAITSASENLKSR